MKVFFLYFIFLSFLDSYEIDFSTYYEQVDTHKKSSITTLYSVFKHENIPTDFGIHYNISATLNTPLAQENNFYNYVEKKAVLRGASLDYYHQNMAVSVGRNTIDLALLNGNFDGIVLYKINKSLSYRLFYFTNYEILLPTYYAQNNSMDLFGTNLIYEKDSVTLKLNLMKNRKDNFLHTSLSYKLDDYNFSFEMENYYSSVYKKENIKKAFVSRNYARNYFELGYIKNGRNSIENIIQFDQTELHYFGLGNKIYMPNAQNVYFAFIQEKDSYYFDVLVGYTRYKVGLSDEILI